MNIDRKVIEQALEALNHGITEMNHRGCAIECMPLHHATKAIREALAQPQPVQQEPIAYLDIGAGGYLDLATDLTDEQLLALPKGRHTLVIAGTFGIDGYTSPQAAQPQPVQQEPTLKVYKGEICYKSEADDQSYGMWCPVTYDYPHGLPDGTNLYTSPQAAQPLTPEWYARWIRNNYQDHPNIATLCEELTKAAHGIKKGTT